MGPLPAAPPSLLPELGAPRERPTSGLRGKQVESGEEQESSPGRQGTAARGTLRVADPVATDRPEQEPSWATGGVGQRPAPESLLSGGDPAVMALVILGVALTRVGVNPGSMA